jgi:hypothetical protein
LSVLSALSLEHVYQLREHRLLEQLPRVQPRGELVDVDALDDVFLMRVVPYERTSGWSS